MLSKMQSVMEYLDLAVSLCDDAKRAGGDHAEVFIQKETSLHIGVRKGEIEDFHLGEERGLAIRTLTGNRLGFAYTSHFSKEAFKAILSEAIRSGEKTLPDPSYFFPSPPARSPSLSLFDETLPRVPIPDKVALTRQMEQVALSVDPRIRKSDGASYQDTISEVFLANTSGLAVSSKSTSCVAYLEVIAEQNEEAETGLGLGYGIRFRALDPEKIGKEAGENAVGMLGGKIIPTQRVDLFLDPFVATQFLGALASPLSAEAVRKGRSLLANQLEKPIASSIVTLIDDGLLPDAIASFPFDGEGVPRQTTLLVEEGILKTYVHNLHSASQFGVSSTGNASRASFKATPEIHLSNFYVKPGTVSPQALFQKVDKGFLVTKVMGMHTVNPISGEFSVGASGYWLEKGEKAYPVRQVTLSGNLLEILKSVQGIANDFRFVPFGGNVGSPTLWVRDGMVSGL